MYTVISEVTDKCGGADNEGLLYFKYLNVSVHISF